MSCQHEPVLNLRGKWVAPGVHATLLQEPLWRCVACGQPGVMRNGKFEAQQHA